MPKKTSPSSAPAHLNILPLGSPDPLAVSIVGANLETVLGMRTSALPPRPGPVHAFLPERGQFDAAKILSFLAEQTAGFPLVLGITQYDLCMPILTFVYGESQLGGKAAVVSMHRLADPDPERTYLRTVKISIHEVGHLLGLGHCWEAGCIMRTTRNLEDVDAMPLRFCDACTYEAARRIGALGKAAQAGS